MLRAFSLSSASVVRPSLRKSFASTVLLTRSWTNETVVNLRREAKARGLSSKGTKWILVQRLQEYEDGKSRDPAQKQSTSVRSASSVASEPNATTPGIPPKSLVPSSSPPGGRLLDIQLPDIPKAKLESLVQIPYVPDFWNSSSDFEPKLPIQEEPLPKLLVVAGADTHHGGGPSHNLLDPIDPISENAEIQVADLPASHSASSFEGRGGLFYDIAEDFGFLDRIPSSKPAPKSFWQLFS